MTEVMECYSSDENYNFAQVAGMIAAKSDLTRIEETMLFAEINGYRKLGIAFCISLSKEAEVIDRIFQHNGFQTVSVMCKAGGLSKELIGMKKSPKPMCNPIAQAKLFNKAGTDLNIIIGLCIGHDSLFIKYSEAPITVLAVKDRVLAHNPLGAVYLADTFYKSKLFPPKEK